MNTTKIKKENLPEIVKKNRDDHSGIFLKAQEKYREVVIAALDEQLQAARNKRPFELVKIVSLVQPQDHTEEYNQIILMLELTEDEIIELNAGEFNCYVQDKWNWSSSWSASNSAYVKHSKLGNA